MSRLNGNERRRLYQLKCVGLAFELGQLKGQVAILQETAAKHLETISELRTTLLARERELVQHETPSVKEE